jgi:hypothetical protein
VLRGAGVGAELTFAVCSASCQENEERNEISRGIWLGPAASTTSWPVTCVGHYFEKPTTEASTTEASTTEASEREEVLTRCLHAAKDRILAIGHPRYERGLMEKHLEFPQGHHWEK